MPNTVVQKTEITMVRWSSQEFKIVERRAKATKQPVAPYIRGAVLLGAAIEGDGEALRLVGVAAFQALADQARGHRARSGGERG
jgi:hypothetical protein